MFPILHCKFFHRNKIILRDEQLEYSQVNCCYPAPMLISEEMVRFSRVEASVYHAVARWHSIICRYIFICSAFPEK